MPSEVVTTLKGDGSAPWIVVHTETAAENEQALTEVMGGLLQTATEASALLAGATRVSNGLGPNAPANSTPPQNQWQGNQRQNVQQNQGQQSQAPSYGQQAGGFAGTPHPEGKQCPMCGAGIVGKQPREKRMWTCPNQRSKGDGHYVEWIN